MKEIPLTQGKVALVDDEDWSLVQGYKWRAGFIHPYWYAMTSVGRKTVYLHRLITRAPEGTQVDHWDHDGLNCVQSNLRIATPSQNGQNLRGARRDSLTGVRGVIMDRRSGHYFVRVIVNRRIIYLGTYIAIEAAEQAAIAGRQKYMTHSSECAIKAD